MARNADVIFTPAVRSRPLLLQAKKAEHDEKRGKSIPAAPTFSTTSGDVAAYYVWGAAYGPPPPYPFWSGLPDEAEHPRQPPFHSLKEP